MSASKKATADIITALLQIIGQAKFELDAVGASKLTTIIKAANEEVVKLNKDED